MATGTYSVRAAAPILRRGEGHVRRRSSLVFGENETIVSTDPNEEGAVHVTEEQLDAILHDSDLRDPASTDASTPGLRVKDLTPEPEHEEPEQEEAHEGGEAVEGAEGVEVQPVPPKPKTRVRRGVRR